MALNASVEIWHAILKFSISVPLFFDPDPVDAYGVESLPHFMYEGPYWSSERTRNSLRRVCRSWDAFLKPYQHRYIRFVDLIHGRVPFGALRSAIRLDLHRVDNKCQCLQYCSPSQVTLSSSKWSEAWRTIPVATAWKLETVNGWIHGEGLLAQRAPGLKTASGQKAGFLPLAPGAFSDLRFLSITHTITQKGPLNLAFLNTLHVSVTSLDMAIEWNLPSLRHLIFYQSSDRDHVSSLEKLLELLHPIGMRLITFHYSCSHSSERIDQRLWAALPIVRSLRLPYKWNDVAPQDHPLRDITGNLDDLWWSAAHPGTYNPVIDDEFHDRISPYLPFFPSHKLTIRMDTMWNQEFFSGSGIVAGGAIGVWISEYYHERSTPFLDAHGDTLFQYIVFLIRAFWKPKLRLKQQQ